MKFKTVADYFQNIERESSRIGMTKLLSELFEVATPHEAELLAYISLGLLRPPYKGFQFNLAEKNLIAVVAQLMNKSEDYVASHEKKIGDLGSVLDDFDHKTSSSLTLLDVYKKLEEIESISGSGSVDEKINATVDLLRHLDPLSAKYCIRIILGTLRLGFSDMTVIDALSWMIAGNKSFHEPIEHAYNISADIGLIAKTIKEGGIEAIKKMHINLGVPIRPAAAERMPTAKEIVNKLGTCVAQPKLDGFRLQVHLDKRHKKPIIHFFSRNLLDMSSMFPDLLKAVESFDVETLIVEGEAIAYDPNTGTFLPFQETVKRKRKHGIEEAQAEYPLILSLFDILYLNGESLLDLTHEQRRTKLHELFKNYSDTAVRCIEEKKIETSKELEDYFNENIAAGLEGLVVKKPDASYQPGKRNFNWIKLKREEVGHIEDTIDCVVLGYYAGSGKRASFGIGAFLIGLYNKTQDRFESIAKIGTGLKDEGWKELKKKLDAIKTDHMPKNVIVAKELYPDVWVYPELVCRIRADEITLSPLHTAGKIDDQPGYALRFPRFMDYRSDKSAEDATEVSEIVSMYKDQYK